MPIDFPVYDVNTGQQIGTESLDKSSEANSRLPPTTAAPEYPYNKVSITRSGHEMHWDDTPGHERIRLSHKIGTYFEVSEDGRKVELVQSNDYKYVKGGLTLTIDNSGDIKVGGNLRLVIGNDAHLEIAGSCTASIGGDMVAAVQNNAEIHAGQDITVTGNNTVVTADNDAIVKSGRDMTAVVGRHMAAVVTGDSYEAVQGDKQVSVNGTYNVLAKTINMTANGGNFTAIASGSVNIDFIDPQTS